MATVADDFYCDWLREPSPGKLPPLMVTSHINDDGPNRRFDTPPSPVPTLKLTTFLPILQSCRYFPLPKPMLQDYSMQLTVQNSPY